MSRPLAITGARLLDPASGMDETGDLLVVDGKIQSVGGAVPRDSELIDGRGLCLSPGLIDIAVFTGEPGQEQKGTLGSAGRAAAAGGVTGFCVMPNTEPVLDDVSLIDFIHRRAAETSPVRVYPLAAATRGAAGRDMAEIGLLAEAGARAFTDGRQAVAEAGLMRRILAYATGYDALVMQHPEEPSLGGGAGMNSGELATRLGLRSSPPLGEQIMVERDSRLAESVGAKLHFTQITCAASIAAVRAAKARGARITCGTSPAHFALNETAVGNYRTFAKVCPPLRAESDRQAVAEALADRTIDVIASFHDPQDVESKRLPFAQAAPGIVGLETLLPLALELYHNGSVPLLRVLGALTVAPADLLGLPGGRLAAGAPADLLLFDLDAPWVIDATKFQSKCANTPFDGRPVQGRVKRTLVGGQTVFAA